ncbi:MAG TPA: hypothetical protein VMV22_08975 [Acidimicrobiales bacterium]|nr:hypothetical protein [Acidimicrobiales bacterium]
MPAVDDPGTALADVVAVGSVVVVDAVVVVAPVVVVGVGAPVVVVESPSDEPAGPPTAGAGAVVVVLEERGMNVVVERGAACGTAVVGRGVVGGGVVVARAVPEPAGAVAGFGPGSPAGDVVVRWCPGDVAGVPPETATPSVTPSAVMAAAAAPAVTVRRDMCKA